MQPHSCIKLCDEVMESERENVHTARTMKKNTRHRVIRDFSQHK